MKVIGVCTDNAANMRKAWKLVKDKYPHIQTYGCLAHALNQIFSDLNKIKTAETIQRDCTAIVKTIKISQKLCALLKQHHQQSPQLPQQSLKLPVKTR